MSPIGAAVIVCSVTAGHLLLQLGGKRDCRILDHINVGW
jgi:hypothetical protein